MGKICHIGTCATNQAPNSIKISAKELSYNSLNSVYKAHGQVHVEQPLSPTQSRNLYADELVYDQIQHQVIATGHVILKDESGNVSYADRMLITDDLKDGLIESLTLITKHQERVLSKKATRQNGNLTHFSQASYTPCQVCEKDDAFWQINANEVIHDQDEHTIYYHNATLEFYGMPIFYTPYFSHPDPSIKRKSGVLAPIPGSTTKTGLYVSQPYYYAIDDTSDLTFTPTFMTKENPSIMAQYRKNMMDTRFDVSGSFHRQKHLPNNPIRPTHPINEPNHLTPNRWHFFSNMDYHIDDHQRLNFKINRASDTTYLSLHPFNEQGYSSTLKANRNLTSHIVYENLHEHTLFSAKSMAYQTDTPKTTPFVLPHVNYDHFSTDTLFGGHYHVHGNIMGLKRTWGVPGIFAKETGRLSLKGKWQKSILTDLGHLFGFGFTLRQDVYFIGGYNNQYHAISETDPTLHMQQQNNNKIIGRFFPQATVHWQYPLISYQDHYSYLIEPKVMCIIGTHSKGSHFIPNNDSRTFTLDDTTLFLSNRYDSFDRIDSGSRIIVGIEQKIERSHDASLFRSISWLFGQSRRLDNQQILEHTHMGENNKYSDFVNRIKIEPYRHIFLRLRNAIDTRTRRQRFMEIGALIGQPIAQLDIGYVKMAHQSDIKKTALSQLNWKVSSKINKTWSLSYGEVRNFLHNTTGLLDQYASVSWENDCFKVETGLHKTRIQLRDIEPSTSIVLVFTFKNLGSFAPSNTSRYPKSILSQF